jgi:hypothetical protein
MQLDAGEHKSEVPDKTEEEAESTRKAEADRKQKEEDEATL